MYLNHLVSFGIKNRFNRAVTNPDKTSKQTLTLFQRVLRIYYTQWNVMCLYIDKKSVGLCFKFECEYI